MIGLRALLVFAVLFLGLHGMNGVLSARPDVAILNALTYLVAITVLILAFVAVLVLPLLLIVWCSLFFPLRWVNLPDRVAAFIATGIAGTVSPILVMFGLALDPDNWEKPEPWSRLTSIAWIVAALYAATMALRVFAPHQSPRA